MESPKRLNVFFVPHCGASHILPLVDVARLFAAHGVIAHIITTHGNALLFQDTVNQDIQHGSQIILHKLHFPFKEVGLPEGVENYTSTTSIDMTIKVSDGLMLLRKPMEQLLRDSRPDCIVSDMFFPWTLDVAEELGIPRVHFFPSGYFPRSVIHNLKTYAPHEKVEFETESFEIPHLPDVIQMQRSQIDEDLKQRTAYGVFKEQMEEAETRSFGTIMYSFFDLEPTYFRYFKEVTGLRFWSIAPMSLFCEKSIINEATNTGIKRDHHDLFSWLDSREPNSVLYICFGSMVRFSVEQLKEIASALAAVGKPFIWVCRRPQNISEAEQWLPEGFEERIREQNIGFVIKGWAPQALILDHPSIAGFMSHCGWNSVIETAIAGVPLIAWPLFSEQFYNEKLVVNVLKIGIEIGCEHWNKSFHITTPTIKREKIEKAVRRYMSGSEEVLEMRRRAKELKKLTHNAVEEGGCSYSDLMALISELKSAAMVKCESGL